MTAKPQRRSQKEYVHLACSLYTYGHLILVLSQIDLNFSRRLNLILDTQST